MSWCALRERLRAVAGQKARALLDLSVLSLTCSWCQIRDIGSGNFGVAKLMRDKQTSELVAVKFIERGEKVGPVCHLHMPGRALVASCCWCRSVAPSAGH